MDTFNPDVRIRESRDQQVFVIKNSKQSRMTDSMKKLEMQRVIERYNETEESQRERHQKSVSVDPHSPDI